LLYAQSYQEIKEFAPMAFERGDIMPKEKLAPAKDWKARNIDDWNAHTFYAFLRDMHREIRQLDYFAARGLKVDLSLLKQDYEAYGKITLKLFIEQALKEYKGSAKYMICTYQFMHTYMMAQIMPKIQVQAIRDEEGNEVQDFAAIEW
jgi:hypothetical protein